MTKELLICNSTNHMLRAEKLIANSGINVEMVPTPSRFGEICTTALRFDHVYLEKVREILSINQIDYKGIYQDTPYIFPNFLSTAEEKEFPSTMVKIINKISQGKELKKKDIVYLLELKDQQCIEKLFSIADYIRKEIVGDIVDIRGAVEFSNYCLCNCLYCGLRKENIYIPRYRMSLEEILESAEEVYNLGLKTIILQSGEDPWYTTDRLVEIVTRIKEKYKLRITLSVGERSEEDYARLKEAGANNFLLKIEASNKDLYSKIHPGSDYDNRVKCIRALKKLGYVTGSGNIIGLPGQTVEDLAEDILFNQREGINMIGIGPFIPALNTPLSVENHGDIELTLKSIAITRIVSKNVFIPATTAIASLDPMAQHKALQVGANTLMLIITPKKYQELYHIYKNKLAVNLDLALKVVDEVGRKRPIYLKK